MLYTEARDLLLSGRNNSRVITSKLRTTLEHGPNEAVVMRLVDTPIIEWRKDGDVVINSNGWRTVTTKRRFNDYLPSGWLVYSERGIWYVRYGGWDSGTTYAFADNMTLHPDGTVRGAASMEEIKAQATLAKQINAYAVGFVDALFAFEIKTPFGGDCWYCSMRSQTGQTLGDTISDTDHLRSHMEEKYYVPSLLMNAIDAHPVSRMAIWAIQECMNGSYAQAYLADVLKDQIRKSIRSYMRRKFGIG